MKLKKILKIVSNITHVSIENIKGKRRYPELVQARNIYYYFAKKNNHSISKIARKIYKHHATVLHGLKTINRDIETNFLNSATLVEKCNYFIDNYCKYPFCDTKKVEVKKINLINLLQTKKINHERTYKSTTRNNSILSKFA